MTIISKYSLYFPLVTFPIKYFNSTSVAWLLRAKRRLRSPRVKRFLRNLHIHPPRLFVQSIALVHFCSLDSNFQVTCSFSLIAGYISCKWSTWSNIYEYFIARRRQNVNRIARTCIAITPAPRLIINKRWREKNSLSRKQPSVCTNICAGFPGVSKSFPQLESSVVLLRQHDRGTLFTQWFTLLFWRCTFHRESNQSL